jgi:2-phosphosulfolactate phosphatase
MTQNPFLQHGYRCRLDWGRDGARRAALRGDILVVIDVLSFSSAVVTAVHHGGAIIPCSKRDDAAGIASREHAALAVHRTEVPQHGPYSLSPLTYLSMVPGTSVVLPSPNGATCSICAASTPYLFIGSLLNAAAVADAVTSLLMSSTHSVTVIACGERWEDVEDEGERLRFAIEDFLGAGAVLVGIPLAKSPEAELCEMAFRAAGERVPELLLESGSGQELSAKGFGGDVEHASRLNLYESVPVMDAGRFVRLQ